MVVVVEPILAGIEVWRRDPFGAAVFAFSGAPAAGFDQAIVWSAGYGSKEIGAAVDGPGSLLNYQGHPVERLTPDRDVTKPDTDAEHTVPELLISKTPTRTLEQTTRA